MRPAVTVVKNDHTGNEVWRYKGMILHQDATCVVLEARFNRDDLDLGYVVFRRGDRFVEYFYADQWVNIFEVHDVDDDHLKGWYCNFARPALIEDGIVQADDLALDMFVHPDGQVLVLDEDEFAALPTTAEERASVLRALAALQEKVARRAHPFEAVQQ